MQEEQRFSRIILTQSCFDWWNSSSRRQTHHNRIAGARLLTVPLGADIGIMLIVAVMFTAFVLGLNPTCSRAVAHAAAAVADYVNTTFAPAESQAAFSQPDVLLVSPQQADQISVICTLEPRGVRVLLADDIATGLDRISRTEGRIGMLIVDGDLPRSKRLVRQAQQRFPNITVFVLKGNRQPTRIATKLIKYASW